MPQLVENTHIFRCSQKRNKIVIPTGGQSAARWHHVAQLLTFLPHRVQKGFLQRNRAMPPTTVASALRASNG